MELRFICDSENPRSTSLQGLKIIGISVETTSNTQKMFVDLVINLWNSKFNVETKLFTIGTENVPNTDMNVKSAFVAYRNKFIGNAPALNSFLNKGTRNIHAIALLYNREDTVKEIVLNSKNLTLNIDEKITKLIKENLVDMVVYSRKPPYEQCEIFSKLFEDYSNTQYILREFDNAQLDRTLNRCSFDKNAFSLNKFKLGKASPGLENDCLGPNFILQNHISHLTDPLLDKPFDNENFEKNLAISEQTDNAQCTSSVDSSLYENLSDELIENQVQKETQASQENACSVLDLGSDLGDFADELAEQIQ